MTRDDKIEKVIGTLVGVFPKEITYGEIAKKILDEIEELEPPKFREYEIVYHKIAGMFCRYCDKESYDTDIEKLSTEELAHTTAPPDAVKWRLNNNYIVFLRKDERYCQTWLNDNYRTYCPHDGQAEGTL